MITINKDRFESYLEAGVKTKAELFQEAESILEANPDLKDFPYSSNDTYKIFVSLFRDGFKADYENVKNSLYWEPGTPYAAFKISRFGEEIKLKLELNCRNIEGNEEILDKDLEAEFDDIEKRADFIKSTISLTIEDAMGVKDENYDHLGLLDQIRASEFSNVAELQKAKKDALRRFGFDSVKGTGFHVEYYPENRDMSWAKVVVDISDRGQDDWGDVCSNVSQIMHIVKIRL